MKVLVIEDDPVIGKSLYNGFTEEGYECTWAKSVERASGVQQPELYDVIVLDILLPGKSGIDVLKEIRSQGVLTPVILITALGSVEERVAGLNAGADDYLVKPFDFAELVARIQAVHRRAIHRPMVTPSVGDLTLDLTTRRARRGELDVDLTPTEASLLEMLMRHAGQVVTRKMLCEHVWNFSWEGPTNVIEVHINRLRNKLDCTEKPPLIQTVRGRGYALRAH